ncbi:telomere recombination family protein [Lyngbya aestuarii BL J]|uniref:L-threonylcarbamoyladenylate synthase n=1 Tax=Lyngbya aestuarii BL J TaxID=1348334 RepID=U7QDP9_9CYAN|nr:L-threonylcarbamoyladenylate synthase [Lyngbya aestuarii]ERT05938.1 telomere recombination family protein [Lyngbya aestuarii BL J]
MVQVSLDTLVEAAISGDQVVSFPTDTVPALAVQPQQAELIFQLKQRSADKPLILMGATPESLWPFVQGTVEELQVWSQMARQYWPGALTLVLPASEKVPRAMNPSDPTTIGLRIPNAEMSRAILQRTGPLATTSANLSGQPPLLTMAEIEVQFPQVFTLDPGELKVLPEVSRVPSTVIKWNRDGSWNILRQGAIRLKFQ